MSAPGTKRDRATRTNVDARLTKLDSRLRRARPALPPKRERFAQLYVSGASATDAARDAGYSARSARSLGCWLLGQPEVRERIDELLATATAAAASELAKAIRREALQGLRITANCVIRLGFERAPLRTARHLAAAIDRAIAPRIEAAIARRPFGQ